MRRVEVLLATAASAAAVGVLVATALPGDAHRTTLADRIGPVEVRTEVVRRTINVYRREHPQHTGSSPGARGASRAAAPSSAPAALSRASGRGAASIPAGESQHSAPVRARSSGGPSSSGGSHTTSPASAPRTRSSGTGSATPGGARKPARTRTSGGHGDDGGSGHDD